MKDPVKRIEAFNHGRYPAFLQMKYRLMRADAFSFYRGTCHLFYEDWLKDTPLNNAPAVWVSGDLHLENFGSYKGANRLVYFDINDFDDALLAPCTWDLARFLTSILVGAHTLNVDETQALTLCHSALDAYVHTLTLGMIRSVERSTSKGMVRELLVGLKQREQRTFIDAHTEKHSGERRLMIDNKHTFSLEKDKREHILGMVEAWRRIQPHPAFLKVIDIARRAAGIASLGLESYVLLVEGKGSPSQNLLLHLKEEQKSALASHTPLKQPIWKSEADRVVHCQRRSQGTPPALLHSMRGNDKAYLLRELQPLQDRVVLNGWNGKIHRLDELLGTMGAITAWDHLRSTGRQGSAIADDLMAFAQNSTWREPLLQYAHEYHDRVKADYAAFCTAYDSSMIKNTSQ